MPGTLPPTPARGPHDSPVRQGSLPISPAGKRKRTCPRPPGKVAELDSQSRARLADHGPAALARCPPAPTAAARGAPGRSPRRHWPWWHLANGVCGVGAVTASEVEQGWWVRRTNTVCRFKALKGALAAERTFGCLGGGGGFGMCVWRDSRRDWLAEVPLWGRGQNGPGEGYLSSLTPGPRREHRDRSPSSEPSDASAVCRVPFAPRRPWRFAGPQSCKGTHCLGWSCSVYTGLASLPACPEGCGSPATSHPGSESPRSIRGPARVVSEAPRSGASSLPSRNTSCFKLNQPHPPALSLRAQATQSTQQPGPWATCQGGRICHHRPPHLTDPAGTQPPASAARTPP